jgi:hypothetical protein
MEADDDLLLIRETVRLLEGVPFGKWPSFEVEAKPFVTLDIPLWPPGEAPPPEIAARIAEFEAHRKRVDNDIGIQAGRVRVSIEDVRMGRTKDFMWPDALQRVAILLRRRGETDLEKRFLTAFITRFPDASGYRYRELVKRLERLSST